MTTADDTRHKGPLPTAPVRVGVCVLLAIAGFFLWQEHRADLLGVLPYLLLLACPFIHLFMHHGHDGHRAGHEHRAHDRETGDRS